MSPRIRILAAALVASADPERADGEPCACSPNRPGFHPAGHLTGDWGGARADLALAGVELQGTYAGEVFAAPALDGDRAALGGLATLAIDLDLATLAHPRLGSIHITGLGIHGRGLSERLMDVYGLSGNTAPPDVRLFEAWIEQPIGPLALRAGLLSADQELVLATHSSGLLNATFGIIAMFSYNLGGPVYPEAALGASAHLELGPASVRAAVYDGDRPNAHGIPTGLGDDALAVAEVELAGTLKLGAWHHTGLGSACYAIADRHVARYLGAFARFALAPGTPIELYADAGIRIGPGPLRPRDFLSAGLVFARTELGAQTAVEVTYQLLATGWLTIQPDAQLVLTREGTTAVLATRAIVAF